MIKFNCLIQNTALYNDLSNLVKKIVYERVADKKGADLLSIYREVKTMGLDDVDIDTVGELYKDVRGEMDIKHGNVGLDSDAKIDKTTSKFINEQVRRIISDNRKEEKKQVGFNRPSRTIGKNIMRLFEDDFINAQTPVVKTAMREMQDAINKSAVALLNRRGVDTKQMTAEEILNKALKEDELAVKDVHGQLNTMDDLFNQVKDEINDVVFRMEQSKRGKSKAQQDEIDQKIALFKMYTENIKQGAYTLALSKSEQNKVIRDLLAEKYYKTITSNGVKRNVLDWNELLKSQNLEDDIRSALRNKGYAEEQIEKITKALEFRLAEIKKTSQWNNSLKARERRLINDDAFLDRATATVAMSKKDATGKSYSKYNSQTGKNEPDWERYQKDTGKTMQDLKEEIRAIFANTEPQSADAYIKTQKSKDGKYYIKSDGSADWNRYAADKGISIDEAKNKIQKKVEVSASQYRQIISELERQNNPTTHVAKSDLERLSELADRRGFDSLFNAKALSILGLTEKDAEAGKLVEDLTKQVKNILANGGSQSKIALGKVMDAINQITEVTQNDKSKALRLARHFDWFMTNRNAYRILSVYNVGENTFSGVSQLLNSYFQTADKRVAKKELSKMLTVFADVSAGGRHFDMTNVDKISFTGHEYRFDPNQQITSEHNIKAALSVIPNMLLGAMDSAVHSYAMRTMFYNSVVKTYKSQLAKSKFNELAKNGYSEKDAREIVKKESKLLEKKAIDDVTNALYDDTKEKELRKTAEEVLKLSTPNPTEKEILRETQNLMLENVVSQGLVTKGQFDALLKGSDIAAKKALGKEAAVNNFISKGLSGMQMRSREKIKNNIQKGNYTKAAALTTWSAIVHKGLLPFMAAGVNWGIITGKKTGLGALRAFALNKKSFQEQIENAANFSPTELEKLMESYNSRRNDVYYGMQGLVFFAMFGIGLGAAYAASGDSDKDEFLDWVNELFREKFKDKRVRKSAQRMLPPTVHIYNLISSNIEGDKLDNAMNFFGAQAMESPLEKGLKFVSKGHKEAGLGQNLGSIFDVGTYYNWANSWADLFGEEQTDKVKAHSGAAGEWVSEKMGLEDNDFINGIMSGFLGYNLNQDINHWTGFTPR